MVNLENKLSSRGKERCGYYSNLPSCTIIVGNMPTDDVSDASPSLINETRAVSRLVTLLAGHSDLALKVRIFNRKDSQNAISVWMSTSAVLSDLPASVFANDASDAFEILEHPKKGLCMYAKRALTRGSTIVQEVPILVIHQRVESSLEVLEHVVDRLLPAELQNQIYALEAPSRPGEDILQAIWRNNAHSITISGEIHSALFNYSSRISHSCSPNAVHHFCHKSLAYTLVSQKDISVGEEIAISYYPLEVLLLPHRERRDSIHKHRGFHCACCACEAQSADNDRLRQLISTKSDALYSRQSDATLDAIQEVLELHDQAHLETGKASLAVLGARRAQALRRERDYWTFLAAQETIIRYGVCHLP